jgi:hypothetical protein
VSFNFAAILMVALVLTLAWAFLSSLRLRLGPKLLAIGALAIGGTGISPPLHFITAENSAPFFSCVSAVEVLVYNSQLIGLFNASIASDAWRSLFGDPTLSIRLPIETFGYQIAIGSYHSVLSGFLLQFLALAIMAAIPGAEPAARTRLEFVLGLTIPLTLAANAWMLPLQGALVGAWKLWDWRTTGYFRVGSLGVSAAASLCFCFHSSPDMAPKPISSACNWYPGRITPHWCSS